jgi:hypothetical protein
MLVNPSMREKYPMWYDAMEKQQKQQEIDNMLLMAELEFSQFVDAKIKEIEDKVREIENSVNKTSYSIEATLNNQPITNSSAINREVKKMVVKELEKALKGK